MAEGVFLLRFLYASHSEFSEEVDGIENSLQPILIKKFL